MASLKSHTEGSATFAHRIRTNQLGKKLISLESVNRKQILKEDNAEINERNW